MRRPISATVLLLLHISASWGQGSNLATASTGIDNVLQDFFLRVRAEEQLGNLAKRRLLSWSPAHGSFHEFLSGLLGANWTDYVPAAWASPGFSWDKLGSFSYESNLQAFLEVVETRNATVPQNLQELQPSIEERTAPFCTPERYLPSQAAYASCSGPTVTLAYVPKVCSLDETTHQVVCDPAKIVLTKAPGGCTHKYATASSWTGKECKIAGTVGFTKEAAFGGGSFKLPAIQNLT